MVSGLLVREIVIFHDMDADGHPIEKLDFYQDSDAVLLWVNMTDIKENDTIVFDWRNPAGELYTSQEWVAPSWIDSVPYYSMFTEIEIKSEPAENMLGMWDVTISVDDEWWTHSFSLNGGNEDGTSTSTGDYFAITDLRKPSSYTPGENVTMTLTLEYSFSSETNVAPSIWNNNTWTFIATEEDTLVGTGTKTYDLEFMADETGTAYYAIAYFIENEEIIYDEYHGIVPFVLESDGDTQQSLPSLDDIDLPSNIDVDEIKSQINDYIGYGLEFIENIEVPDELKEVEETIKEKTGIPGYPVDSILAGATLLGLYLRKKR